MSDFIYRGTVTGNHMKCAYSGRGFFRLLHITDVRLEIGLNLEFE